MSYVDLIKLKHISYIAINFMCGLMVCEDRNADPICKILPKCEAPEYWVRSLIEKKLIEFSLNYNLINLSN